MLTMIGLGLGGPNSITMDGVIALSMSEHIFYETYTSPIHSETLEWIEMKSERKPIYLARSQVEEPEELVKFVFFLDLFKCKITLLYLKSFN